MKDKKPLYKRKRRGIGYDKDENVYYVESKSRKNFYHEVQNLDNKWSCNCEYGMLNNFDGPCNHIRIIVWYKQYQPHLIDPVFNIDGMKILRIGG